VNESSSVFWAAFGGGAAAGIFTFGAMMSIELYRWFIDRPLLRVSVSLGYIYNLPGISSETQYVFIKAANPHSKPVTLSTFGLSFRNRQNRWVIIYPQFFSSPYQLDGSKSVSAQVPTQWLLNNLIKDGLSPSKIKCAYFQSATGNVYQGKLHPETIKSLEKAYENLGSGKR